MRQMDTTYLFNRYRRVFGRLFTAAAVFLAIAGSWQYYSSAVYAGEVIHERLLSTVLFSVLKLFTFAPTAGTGVPTPLLYELAKWLCPLCTGYWIFSALEVLLRNRFERMYRKLRKRRQIAVFGYNEESLGYIRGLMNERGHGDTEAPADCVIFTEVPLEEEERLGLEREHIMVEDAGSLEVAVDGDRRLRSFFETFSEVALFSEDALSNFSTFRLLSGYLERHKEMKIEEDILCFLRCEDPLMERLIMEYHERVRDHVPMELLLFDISSMAARELFDKESIYGNILSSLEHCCDTAALDASLFSYIPEPHVLIAGFGPYGKALLHQVLLMGDLTPCSEVRGYERLRITVVDKKRDEILTYINDRYPAIDRICELDVIGADIRSHEAEERLDTHPVPTYVIIDIPDMNYGIEALYRLESYLGLRILEDGDPWGRDTLREADSWIIPTAILMDEEQDRLRSLIDKGGQSHIKIVPFGGRSDILKRKYMIEPKIEKAAMDFNRDYQLMQRIISGEKRREEESTDAIILWKKLDHEKRSSNRAQAACRPYIRSLLGLLPKLPQKESILATGSNTELVLSRLKESPILDRLAAWEHRRWCNFHYASGYIGYDEDHSKKGSYQRIRTGEGTIYGRVHDCLIDDWEELKMDPSAARTIIYDLCAVYACDINSEGGGAECQKK